MKISKSVAQYMNNVGIAGSIVAILYSIYFTNKIAELEGMPQYQAAQRIGGIAEETDARLRAIDECAAAHPSDLDSCLEVLEEYGQYVDDTQEEAERLRTSFPHYRESQDEMERLRRHMIGSGIGLITFGSLTVAGNFAYRRREKEEAAAGKAQHQKVSDLYPR